MRHASIANYIKSIDDREPYSDRHAHMFASRAYHHAKQRGFLTGDDVLKSLEAEMESNDDLEAAIHKVSLAKWHIG